MHPIIHFCGVILLFWAVAAQTDYPVKDYNGREVLDPRGKYLLEWSVNWQKKLIYFNITLSRTGWVGLGFSADGQMRNADIMYAWISSDGKPYIQDYYTDCDRNLKLDAKQDWVLLGATEVAGSSKYYISRMIDTCDPQDYPVTDDLAHLLWAYGETDVLKYHYENRGDFKVYLLDPVMHPSAIAATSPVWRVGTRMPLPIRKSNYWCTIHKVPSSVNKKQHIIQMSRVFGNEVSLHHTHHFVVYACHAPKGNTAFSTFEPLVFPTYGGEECYFPDGPPKIDISLCRRILYFWTLGANPFILPYDVGFPFGETGPNEYVLMETHVKNPEEIPGILYEGYVDFIYTDKLRRYDGGGFLAAYDLTQFYLIPPAAYDFEVIGHCGTSCTSAMFPSTGVDVFAVHLHSHSSALKMKLHHFRDNKEKPWIMKDDNYDFKFQQQRPLHYNRKLLPGDQLVVRCTYDFSNNTEVAGLSFQHKMAVAMIYHVTQIPYYLCASHFPQDTVLSLIGINNATWDAKGQERIVHDPAQFEGRTVQSVSNQVDWTVKLRQEVQSTTLATPQTYVCPRTEDGKEVTDAPPAIYPFIRNPYGRVRYCPSTY